MDKVKLMWFQWTQATAQTYGVIKMHA